ncbi:MAG: type IV secretory system conjugative DNA transfer family protein, partial [Bacteroidia bacterium]|nr:type IV secretory system conjugative DNA transfer family protein [Bacteroidia bacterium]
MIKRIAHKLWPLLVHLANQLMEITENGLNSLVDLISEKDHSHKASFDRESSILSRLHRGFNLTGKSIDFSLSAQGVLVNGNTGSGKSTVACIRSILTVNGSQVIFDPSGELFEKTSGALAEQGVHILQVNWCDPQNSQCFNPLTRAQTLSQKTKLASQLMSFATKKGEKDFWSSSAINALVIVMRIVCLLPVEYRHLHQVAVFLDVISSTASRQELNKLMAILSDQDPGLFEQYESLLASGESTLPGILASAKTAVSMFLLDENLAAVTARDTMEDFMKLRRKKTALFVHSATTSADYYAHISNIFFQQFFEAFFERLPGEDDSYPIFFHLDEFPLLRLNTIDLICANCRKYAGNMMVVTQDAENQLTANYGREKAEAILSNLRTKLFLSASLKTATSLEQELGQFEYEDPKTKQKRLRPLLSKSEIMQL